jgi:hypothetical protein
MKQVKAPKPLKVPTKVKPESKAQKYQAWRHLNRRAGG